MGAAANTARSIDPSPTIATLKPAHQHREWDGRDGANSGWSPQRRSSALGHSFRDGSARSDRPEGCCIGKRWATRED